MSKSAEPLSLRQCDDGKWEVENVPDNWIKCETKEDAQIISNAPIVLQESYEALLPNEKVAARLERMADKLEQYKLGFHARRFRARAKLARGKGS